MKNSLKTILWIAIPVAAIGSVLLYNQLSRKPDAPAEAPKGGGKRSDRTIPVSVYVADYMRIEEGIRMIGTLLPNEEVDIASEVNGKVEQISFTEGAPVRKGSVLVKVNDDDLQSQLRRAIFQRNLLKDKLDRNRILLDKDAISREAFDQIETDYNMIEADIQLLNVRIDKTEIKAPFDGAVGVRYVSPGGYIQPGSQIARLVDYSKLKVEFAVPEKYFQSVRVGAPVSFTVEGSAATYTAPIYVIDPRIDIQTRTMTVRALYENRGMKLLPGMSAMVSVGQKVGESIQIPSQAVVPDADHMSVWVVRGGRAEMIPVVTGQRTEERVEVVRGLKSGDSVVVTGLLQVRDGALLQINN